MARAKKAAKSESAATTAESGASTEETITINDGKTLDCITDTPVAENDQERIRQRIARALFNEYGISVDMEPDSLITLLNHVILHEFNSPASLKHIQKAKLGLDGLTPEQTSNLRPGEAFAGATTATDEAFTKSAVKVRCRPRVIHHGGVTKEAVGNH